MTLEPVTPPARFSQTLLAKADACRRSAYLYLKYPGSTGHELWFGSAGHAFAERLLSDLIAAGQPTLYEPGYTQGPEGELVPEDPATAARQVASMSAAMLDEVMAEHPEWAVPIAHKSHSRDHLRQCAYHLAAGLDVDPQTVLGLEQKFVLDLPCGVTVSGKLDVLADLGSDVLGVDDYKFTFNVPAQADFVEIFQLKLYGVLAMFGVPEVDGVRQDPVGDGIQFVRGRQVYPRYLEDDGTVRTREVVFSRQQLQDWLHDLDALAADVARRLGSLEEESWPAVAGSHCSECPCQMECPLPAKLRDYAGTVNDRERAALALGAAVRAREVANATVREVRNWAKRNGPVVVGDVEWAWRDTTKHDPVDWEGLEAAVWRAQQFGEPFDASLFVRTRVGQSFAKRKLAPAEVAAQIEEEAKADGGSRFGDDAPF